MAWLIEAKIREIQKEIDGHRGIEKGLVSEYQSLPWYKLKQRREVIEERIRELGIIYGLEDAREILKDKSIR